MDIGAEIRRYRKEKAMTVEDLAFASGISTNTIGNIERCVTDPRFTIALDLLDTMGLQIKITEKEKQR